jgi:alcohol dehydrogenase (cytochrome c)
LFYVNASRAFSEYYIFDDTEKPEGWGGNDRGGGGDSMLQALDYKTGKIHWSHKWEGPGARSGVLTTAGNLLFAGDASDNLVALDPATGDALWHANLGAGVSNGPITYLLDGMQYIVVGAGDALFGFVMLAEK